MELLIKIFLYIFKGSISPTAFLALISFVELKQGPSLDTFLWCFIITNVNATNCFTILVCYIHLFDRIVQKDEINKICMEMTGKT